MDALWLSYELQKKKKTRDDFWVCHWEVLMIFDDCGFPPNMTFVSLRTAWKVVLSITGMQSEEVLSNSPYLRNAESRVRHVFSVSRSAENVRTGARLFLSCLPTQPLCCNTPAPVTLRRHTVGYLLSSPLLDELGKSLLTSWCRVQIGGDDKNFDFCLSKSGRCAEATAWKRYQICFLRLKCVNALLDLRQMGGVVPEWVWWFTPR